MLKRIYHSIPSSFRYLNWVFILGLFGFLLFRIIFFIVFKSEEATEFTLVLKCFFFGIRFDNALMCYILILPLVLLFLYELSNFKLKFLKAFAVFFIGLMLIVFQFVSTVDIPYFSQFGNHLNRNALLWKDNAKFVLGFVFESFSYWGFLFLFIVAAVAIIYGLIFLSKKLKAENIYYLKFRKIILLFWFLIYVGVFLIGARGTITGKTPMHEGYAVFSSNSFLNSVCLNPNYSFFKSIIESGNKTEYVIPNNINESFAFAREYLNLKSSPDLNINRTDGFDSISSKPNIVLVVMESMSIAKMGYYNYPDLTPNLHLLNKESVFFNRFFSSGIHTFNGLFSSITGYPSLYAEQGLVEYTKAPFDGLGALLKNQGYDTYFGTTHDSHFDNMEGFFRMNHFDNIINLDVMPSDKVISTLGVPDHVLFDEFISSINSRNKPTPFLGVIMTSSDHGPWKVPTDIDFKPSSKDERFRCTEYADWAIGQFISNAKKQAWYKNTVFLFVADHGFSNGPNELFLTFNHVPFIIHQPAFFKPDTISSPCYQPDIVSTVMGIVGGKYENKTFGLNVLKEKHPFVVFSGDDKLALVDSNGYYYLHTLTDNQFFLRKYWQQNDTNYYSKLPLKGDSLNKKMMHIFNTAHYLIREKYYN